MIWNNVKEAELWECLAVVALSRWLLLESRKYLPVLSLVYLVNLIERLEHSVGSDVPVFQKRRIIFSVVFISSYSTRLSVKLRLFTPKIVTVENSCKAFFLHFSRCYCKSSYIKASPYHGFHIYIIYKCNLLHKCWWPSVKLVGDLFYRFRLKRFSHQHNLLEDKHKLRIKKRLLTIHTDLMH